MEVLSLVYLYTKLNDSITARSNPDSKPSTPQKLSPKTGFSFEKQKFRSLQVRGHSLSGIKKSRVFENMVFDYSKYLFKNSKNKISNNCEEKKE